MSNWKEDGARALPAGCGRGIHHTQLLSWPSTVHCTCTALPYTLHYEADPRTHDTRSHLHHDDDVCALYEMNASAYTEGAGGVHGSVAHGGCMAGAPLRTRMVQERVRSGTRYAPLVSDLCTWRFLTIVCMHHQALISLPPRAARGCRTRCRLYLLARAIASLIPCPPQLP